MFVKNKPTERVNTALTVRIFSVFNHRQPEKELVV